MVNLQEQYVKEVANLYWENGYTPDMALIERLAYFAQLVVEKNKTVNLISRKDVENIIENHIFLSAYISKFFPDKTKNFLDIGTGGGFPGIPLAITKPQMQVVLVDSTAKKIEAVQSFIDALKLSNVTAENYRVEDEEFINKYKDSFELIVSRATVPLITLVRYALPLFKGKVFIAAMKGGDIDDEYKKAEMKYKAHIRKFTTFELSYKPNNARNQKGKKLVMLELVK